MLPLGYWACVLVALLILQLAQSQVVAAQTVYGDDAIWIWAPHADDIAGMCGVSTWLELHPERELGDQSCVVASMRALGASDAAVRFFETTGSFLVSFEGGNGPIDFGRAASPWVNMGRGEAVLLNAAPSAILVSRAFSGRQETWAGAPGYEDLLNTYPRAFPWLEYSGPMSEQVATDGSATVTIAFDMRECRACPNVASMPVAFRFDARGAFTGADVQPPQPPRS